MRQVDRDGTFSYSPVRPVQVPTAGSFAVQAYPQPFGAELSLRLRAPEAGPVSIVLRDAVGRTLLQREATLAAGSTVLPLPARSGRAFLGRVMLSITHKATQHTLKVVRE